MSAEVGVKRKVGNEGDKNRKNFPGGREKNSLPLHITRTELYPSLRGRSSLFKYPAEVI
jgi:hypothetical protein